MSKWMNRFLFGLLFILSFFLVFNYFVFKNINILNTLNLSKMFSNKNVYSDTTYKRDYITENEKINSTQENGMGVTVYTYNLELENLPQDIQTLSLTFEENVDETNQISLSVIDDVKSYTYGEDSVYIKDNNDWVFIINRHDIDKITVNSVYERFSTDTILNDELIVLDSININRKIDKDKVYDSLLSKVLLSLSVTICGLVTIYLIIKTDIDKKIFRKKIKIEKVFLILSLSIGTLFSVMFPLFQIPDELTHINMIYEEIGFDTKFNEAYPKLSYESNLIIRNYGEKVNTNDYFDYSEKLALPNKISFPSVTVIRHLPQAIGIYIGSILHLPVIIGITLAEILAVLFYSFISYKALKYMPFKKELFMMIMLLPICIQQLGSFSYDVVLLSCSYLLISYILYLKFTKEDITLLDILKLLILTGIIAITKIPYVLLLGLVLLLPIEKINLDFKIFKIDGNFIKKNQKKILFITLLFLLIIAPLAIIVLNKINYGRILLASILAPVSTLKILANTAIMYWKGYLIELTGDFGWLDTPVSIWFTIFVIASLILVSFFYFKSEKAWNSKNSSPFKKWETIYIYVLAIALGYIIILSMFEWTIYVTGIENYDSLSISEHLLLMKNSIHVIGGVQGRYFVPIIPLVLLPLYNKTIAAKIKKINYKSFLTLYYFIVVIYMFIIILNRYWI